MNAEQLNLATAILTVQAMAAKLRASAKGTRASASYAEKESQTQRELAQAAELDMQAEALELLIGIAKGVEQGLHDALTDVAEASFKAHANSQIIDLGKVQMLDAAEATAAARVAAKSKVAAVTLHIGDIKVLIPTQPLPGTAPTALPPAAQKPIAPPAPRTPTTPRPDSTRPH